eukprot:1148445-Pelagomonas_calceolata.AAC.3
MLSALPRGQISLAQLICTTFMSLRHLTQKAQELALGQCLGYDVRSHLSSRAVLELDFYHCEAFLSKVIDDVNVLGSCRYKWGSWGVSVLLGVQMSLMSLQSHSTSFTAWAVAMFSVCTVDMATVACSRLDQLMIPPFKFQHVASN